MNENSFWTALWRGMVRPCLGSLESNGMTIWHGLGGWWAVIWMLWDPRVNRKCEWWVEDPRSMKDTWLHEKSEETNLPWATTAILNFVISDLMILAALINPLPSTPPNPCILQTSTSLFFYHFTSHLQEPGFCAYFTNPWPSFLSLLNVIL